MNAQLGRLIYEHPYMRQFEFVMRLDADTKVLEKIPYDPFSFMSVNGFDVGFSLLGMVSHVCFVISASC